MNENKHYTNISCKYEGPLQNAEQPVNSEISLPDYFPDVVRVVRCNLRANINNVSVSADKIDVDCNNVLSLLYLSDDGKPHCFEQRIPFIKSIEIKSEEGAMYTVDAKTQYVNCRVVSQRKLEIRASVSVSYRQILKKEENILCSCDDESVEIKSEKRQITNLTDCAVKYFNVSETLEIGSTQPNISQIVSSDIQALVSSTKLISDKALIKGDLKISILYLSDNSESFEKVESSVPFSQIFEIKSEADSFAFVKAEVAGYDIYAKTDSTGALRMFDFSANIRAQIGIYNKTECEISRDIYSTKCLLQPEYKKVSLISGCESINDTYLSRETFEAKDSKIKKMVSADYSVANITHTLKDSKLCYCLQATLNVLYLNDADEAVFSQKQTEISFEKTVDFTGDSPQFESCAALSALSYNITGDSEAEIRAEFEISTLIYSLVTVDCIGDISTDESERIKAAECITLYFAEKGEDLWDVAKAHNVGLKQLMKDNSLTQSVLEADKKIILISQ